MNCEYYVYGSYAQNTNTDSSDLNIFFDISKFTPFKIEENYFSIISIADKNVNSTSLPSKAQLGVMRNNFKNVLGQLSNDWIDFKCVSTDQILLTAVHKPTNILCSFSFDSSIPIHTTHLINYIFDLYPVCRQLVIFVKQWMKERNLSGISGYVITILVIVFFQRLDLLPSVQAMQERCTSKVMRGCKILILLPEINFNGNL